jgi:hypothetical protein
MEFWKGSNPTQCQLCYRQLKNHFVFGKVAMKYSKRIGTGAGPDRVACLSCGQKFEMVVGGGALLYSRETIQGKTKWICIAGIPSVPSEDHCKICEQPQSKCECV